LPDKDLPEFNRQDFKDNRGEVGTGNGIMYKKELRIYFFSLQEYKETDSAFAGDATHLIFDEAMPSDRVLLQNPNEEAR
jgi:hypothetical protein